MSRTDKDAPRRLQSGLRRWAVGSGPTRQFINDNWTSRERQAARIACREAAKEHCGNGIVDIIPTTRQHRQCAQWLWW
ncbi:hypothetical protein KZZ52_25760 [Dactylosporangium sp. AC04546]|uniref:hypothetical protein n=1 Tax=Dactylosporangium sp. AC04546 TaxID=2862460 RepID=UPI001EDDA59E|nr:hypothetical protein [Dactylosporangium sp. AC04546]WVK88678.1 hypothetical protein KZZ52_25760 [Dactylosporangium sp. AC04546]